MGQSPYLAQALAAIAQQPQGSATGMAANMGAAALQQFAQDRQRRHLLNALDGGNSGLTPDAAEPGGLLARIGGLFNWQRGGF